MRRIWLVLTVAVVVTMGLALLPTVTPAEANGTNIVVLGGSSAVSDSVLSELAGCTSGSVSRIAGSNRYATAAAVSSTFLSPGIDVAYVATGENFPDALAGSAAAGAGAGGPVLLVRPTSVPSETAAELNRLNPNTIVVLGGTAAISTGVESALGAYGTVVRVAGSNRYSTGALVSSYAFPVGATTAYVATGTNFPDALAGGPAAVGAKGPVLLVEPNSIPPSVGAELARLNLSSIKVLGGTAAVSASVESSLKAYAPTVTRLSGSNRYATAAAVSKDTFAPGVGTIFIATGTNFPDALAGGPIAGILGGPILLVEPNSIPSDTRNEIQRLTGVNCQPPAPPRQLVFKDQNPLYVMYEDGSGLRKLELGPSRSSQWNPKWSSDGSRIVYKHIDWDNPVNDGIYVVNADGSNPVRILTDPNATPGDWAPDDRNIVFASTRISATNPATACPGDVWDQLSCDRNLFTVNVVSGWVRQVTFYEAISYEATYSPDHTRIAFTSSLDNDWEIFTINLTASVLTQITFNDEGDGAPAWTPDSQGLVYRGYLDGQSDLWLTRFGSSELRLTNDPKDDDYPAVASDGTIAFTREEGSFTGDVIYIMATDGSISSTGQQGYMPDWRP